MKILGLHFGHDAGVSVVIDGRVAVCILRERFRRVKHAITLEWKDIETALSAVLVSPEQIDYCAITSTQEIELVIDDPLKFSISFAPHPRHTAPCSLADMLEMAGMGPERLQWHSLLEICCLGRRSKTLQHGLYTRAFPEHSGKEVNDFWRFGWIDRYFTLQASAGKTLGEIADLQMNQITRSEVARRGFHYPVTVTLAGRPVAGYFIAHHMAHAASALYQSGFKEAAILTHDGFSTRADQIQDSGLSGLFLYGRNHEIHPLAAHHLELGALYDDVGVRLGFGAVGPSGKLMGLAAYGKPAFFDPAYVGNHYDWVSRSLSGWFEHCLTQARSLGYDVDALAQPERILAPINVDIAASTQKLMEEGYLLAARALYKITQAAGHGVSDLCLSGGCALNCPSNSRLWSEGPFDRIFIEPGCDDSGLAIGAALYLYHNVLDSPLNQTGAPATPYLGPDIAEDLPSVLRKNEQHIRYESCSDPAESAAKELAANRLVGWFEGRSEIGPRALGHRSILADPRDPKNWQRVNRIKGRDWWRPFAPAVLDSEVDNWFDGLPTPSPYMLFNAHIKSSRIPAVTHVDGSARVQTVDASCGMFYRLLQQFYQITGIPVVLNTSFNGPTEPIVESPGDALRFFLSSGLDVLYMGKYRVTKMSSAG